IGEGESGLVHAAHAAARACGTAGCCTLLFVFLEFSDERFGGEHQARDGGCVLQRQASDLGRVDDAHLDHVAIVAGVRVEAVVFILRLADLADYHSAFVTSVQRDLASRLFESALHDANADSFVIMQLELLDGRKAVQKGSDAAGDDAFLNWCAGGVHSVLDASLLLLQLGFGRSANLDDRNAAHQLGKALLELFLVVVRGGVFHLQTNLLYAAFDFGGLAGAFHDGGVVLVDRDLLGAAEIFDLHVFQLDTEIFGDGLAAGQGSDVFEHSLAAVAAAGRLDSAGPRRATKRIHHECRERFALDIFSDDQQRLSHLCALLPKGEQGLPWADLLFINLACSVFPNALPSL